MRPSPGGLDTLTAGFETGLGKFNATFSTNEDSWMYSFETPLGTNGCLSVERPECDGVLKLMDVSGSGADVVLMFEGRRKNTGEGSYRLEIDGIRGGRWKASMICSTGDGPLARMRRLFQDWRGRWLSFGHQPSLHEQAEYLI